MKPGVTIMPLASTVNTEAPAHFFTSALEPTASIRSPRTRIASAQGRRVSPVQTRAFTIARARTVLRHHGFVDDEFTIGEARSSCGKDRVCEQVPKAGIRKYAQRQGDLNLGD